MSVKDLREYMMTRIPDFKPSYRSERGIQQFKTKQMLLTELEPYSAVRLQAMIRRMQARRRLEKKKLVMQMNLPHNVALKIARQI